MANKEVIELGRKLHRLKENEDFKPFMNELDNRIEIYKEAMEVWDGYNLDHSMNLTRLAHKIDALRSLKEWMEDCIESGGREKMRQEAKDGLQV